MRSLSFFLPVLFLIGATPAFADTQYQHRYVETVYDTYPPEMAKIQNRVQTWMEQTDSQIDEIRNSVDPQVVAWRRAIMAIPMYHDIDMLKEINRITNQAVTYRDDYSHYSKDYWAPPIETLTEGGDCEDIALLKVVALHLKEWDLYNADNIHLLIGLLNYQGKSVPHADLEVDTGSEHYVMRSLVDEVLPFDDMSLQMKPLYMIDASQVVTFSKPVNTLGSLAASAGARNGETVPIQWNPLVHWDPVLQ